MHGMWFRCCGRPDGRPSSDEHANEANGDAVEIKAAKDSKPATPADASPAACSTENSLVPAQPVVTTAAVVQDVASSSNSVAQTGSSDQLPTGPTTPPRLSVPPENGAQALPPQQEQQQQQQPQLPRHLQPYQSTIATTVSSSPRVRGGLMTAKELFSDITNLVFLGAGAYGSVYEGMWHGAVVAIKFIKSETLDPKSASAREATFSSMLAHPHVVQTFWSRSGQLDEEFIDAALKEHMQQRSVAQAGNSFVSNEGFGDPNKLDNAKDARTVVTVYSVLHALNAKAGNYLTAIAMEFMDNCSLHEVVAQGLFQANSKWGPRIVLRALSRTAREVARGMWHLHSSGVIHGDLKPANVLLKHSRADRRGFVCKVSDFGLSRECVEAERLVSAETWGTVSYMAPEHFKGHLCQASDVYSFGVMLQEMYTAERPYKNFSFGQIMMGVQSGQLRLQWPPGAPPPLATLSQRCMAYNAADRPTFDVIIEELNSMETALRMEEYSRRTNLDEEAASLASRDSSQTKLSVHNDLSSQSFNVKVPKPLNTDEDKSGDPKSPKPRVGPMTM